MLQTALYERNRRITFVVRIFISKNYDSFEGFSTIHFGASGNPSLFDFAYESTGCCASFIQIRMHLRVTTDSMGARALPRQKQTFPRFECICPGWPTYSLRRENILRRDATREFQRFSSLWRERRWNRPWFRIHSIDRNSYWKLWKFRRDIRYHDD